MIIDLSLRGTAIFVVNDGESEIQLFEEFEKACERADKLAASGFLRLHGRDIDVVMDTVKRDRDDGFGTYDVDIDGVFVTVRPIQVQ